MINLIRRAGLTYLVLIAGSMNLHSQTEKENSYFPLTISFIEVYDLDTSFNPAWITKSIPPNRGYRMDDYSYKLVITINVIDQKNWNEPFVLIYELPNSEREFIVINEERYELSPDNFNKFLVEVHTKEKGWAKFELALFNDLSGGFYIPLKSYPLRRRDFLLE